MTAVLEVNQISKRFGGLTVLHRVDMEVYTGEIVGLIGPNGAGKTTLINVISGFLKPDDGSVRCNGKNISGLPPHQIAAAGLVRTFQRSTLFSGMTVWENVMVGMHLGRRRGLWSTLLNTKGYRREEDQFKARSMDMCQRIGFNSRLHADVDGLPHGDKRLLGLSIALAAEPAVLLLDEPLSGMTSEESEFAMKRIQEVKDKGRTGIILVEHNVKAVMAACDRVVVLNYGEKLTEGKPYEVAANASVIEAYLGAGTDVT